MAREDDKIDLLDRLYGEPGDVVDDEATRDELASYGRLRTLMRELPDEEPSPSISAQLLHAAAQAVPARGSSRHAAVAPPSVGVWGKLKAMFRPVAMHPGVAAMATLVLVAGIGGALYLRKDSKFAEPRVASEAAPAQSSGSPMTDTTLMPPSADPAPAAVATEDKRLADLLEPTPSGGEGRIGVPERKRVPLEEKQSGAGNRSGGAKGDASGGATGATTEKSDLDFQAGLAGAETDGEGEAHESSTGSAPGGGDGVGSVWVDGRSSTSIDVTTPEPTVKPSDEPEAPTTPPDGKTAATKEETSKTAEARTQTRRAIELAKRGDCAGVDTIASRVRSLDAYVYDTEFLRDASISACRDKAKAGTSTK